MPLNVIVGTSEKACVKIDVAKATLKRATRIEAYDGSAWKLVQSFLPPISLSAYPDQVDGERNVAAVVVISTGGTTATVTGGQGPYTYAWTQTGGPGATINNPNFATTNFSMPLGPGSSEQSQFTCTVTDSNGLTAQAVVTAFFSNTSGA